jgi:hypothetical protein
LSLAASRWLEPSVTDDLAFGIFQKHRINQKEALCQTVAVWADLIFKLGEQHVVYR